MLSTQRQREEANEVFENSVRNQCLIFFVCFVASSTTSLDFPKPSTYSLRAQMVLASNCNKSLKKASMSRARSDRDLNEVVIIRYVWWKHLVSVKTVDTLKAALSV